RQPIYEKDRLDPVDPAARLELSPGTLARFPEGYRHLAYLQAGVGYDVKPDMPGLTGPGGDALYQTGKPWPAGGPCGQPGAPPAASRRWRVRTRVSPSVLGRRAAAAAGGWGGRWRGAAG